jgi:hypothetical protein
MADILIKAIEKIAGREAPILRSKWILEGNIKYREEVIPQFKNLLERMKAGEKIRHINIGGVHYLFPEIKDIENKLREKEEKLPKLKQWLEELKEKELRKVI